MAEPPSPTEAPRRTSRQARMNTLAPPPGRPIAHVYDAAYAGVPNWDVGHPQRAFVALEESGRIEGPVLDVGCGTGELSLYLARQGHRTLGIDLSPRAIVQAKQKAKWRRIDAQFMVWDALDVAELRESGLSFRTAVDSAMFHVLGERERDRFASVLADVVRRGGHYYVLGDARLDDRTTYGLTPYEIRERFESTGAWTVEFAYETGFERRWGASRAYLVGVRRT